MCENGYSRFNCFNIHFRLHTKIVVYACEVYKKNATLRVWRDIFWLMQNNDFQIPSLHDHGASCIKNLLNVIFFEYCLTKNCLFVKFGTKLFCRKDMLKNIQALDLTHTQKIKFVCEVYGKGFSQKTLFVLTKSCNV